MKFIVGVPIDKIEVIYSAAGINRESSSRKRIAMRQNLGLGENDFLLSEALDGFRSIKDIFIFWRL